MCSSDLRAQRKERQALAAAAVEAKLRRQAEEQARVIEEQRKLLESNARVNSLVTNEILGVLRDVPVPAAKRRALMIDVLSRLGDLHPVERVKAFHAAGDQFVLLKEYPTAIGAFNEGLALDPQHAGIYVSRGDAFFLQKEYAKAISDYTAAIANRRKADRVGALVPYAHRGVVRCQLGQLDEALLDFRTSYEGSPKPTLDRLVSVFSSKTFPLKAPLAEPLRNEIVRLFDRYLETEQRSTEARLFVAESLAELKLPELARQHLEAADPVSKGGWYVQYRLAALALRRGDDAEYRRICRDMLAMTATAPESAGLHTWATLTSALSVHALDGYSAAIELARGNLAKKPDSVHYRLGLGAILLRAGRIDEARTELQRALETNDGHQKIKVQYYLAITFGQLGDYEAAKQWLETADAAAKALGYANWLFEFFLPTTSRRSDTAHQHVACPEKTRLNGNGQRAGHYRLKCNA